MKQASNNPDEFGSLGGKDKPKAEKADTPVDETKDKKAKNNDDTEFDEDMNN